ncbi:MAG: DUF4286 family protein [Saprospiraceae bacterium]
MIIYNVTVKINLEIESDWLLWMKSHHIPDVLNTGSFLKCRILKLLIDETDGSTYAIQYDCESQEVLDHYRTHLSSTLQKDHTSRYEGKFVAFRTTLELIEELVP